MSHLTYRSILLGIWLINLIGIFSLSVFGRRLQYWAADQVGYTTIAWLISIILLGLILAYLYWLKPRLDSLPWLHLCWFLSLFLLGPFYYERIEERIHFLSFGLFGVFSILLFSPRMALLWCLGISVGDEVLQHFLADRVGDWADVLLNSIASLGAALFVWLTLNKSISRRMK